MTGFRRYMACLTLLLVLGGLVAVAPPARADWIVPGGGTAQAAAASIAAPATPIVSGSGPLLARTFTVTWTAPAPGPVPVTGYWVTRTSSLLGAGVISLGTCTGGTVLGSVSLAQPVLANSTFTCTDITVGALGMVQYTVTPMYERWIGPASAWSSAAN